MHKKDKSLQKCIKIAVNNAKSTAETLKSKLHWCEWNLTLSKMKKKGFAYSSTLRFTRLQPQSHATSMQLSRDFDVLRLWLW